MNENRNFFEADSRPSGNGFEAGNTYRNAPYGTPSGSTTPSLTLNAYIIRTYLWMFLGLALTFVTGFVLSRMNGFVDYLQSTDIRIPLIVVSIVEFGVVIFLSLRIQKLSVGAARALFLVYAALTGVTFATYFVVFDAGVLMITFAITALFFGGMAAVAHIFKLELGGLSHILFGGLIAIIVLTVISIFGHWPWLYTLISYLGIAIFLGYTAYDSAKIKEFYYSCSGDSAMLEKASIFSALQLYLDFINLFLYILRIVASSSSKD